MSATIHSVNSVLESALFGAFLDSLIWVVAFLPVAYVSARFLSADAAHARRLVNSPRLMGWLFFFCCFEILLHALKIPIFLKIAVIILAIIAFPIVFLLEMWAT